MKASTCPLAAVCVCSFLVISAAESQIASLTPDDDVFPNFEGASGGALKAAEVSTSGSLRLVLRWVACLAALVSVARLAQWKELLVALGVLKDGKSHNSGMTFSNDGKAGLNDLFALVRRTRAQIGKTTWGQWLPYMLYVGFVLGVTIVVECLREYYRSQLFVVSPRHPLWSIAAVSEGLGLLVLRCRIQEQRSAAGVSAKCIGLYAILYTSRFFNGKRLFALSPERLDFWGLKIAETVSFVLVLDVLRLILVKFRSTYNQELDKVPIFGIVLAAFVLSMIYRPYSRSGAHFSRAFTFGLFLDSVGFVPQVVLMARQECSVQAPIAHFVVATALSRIIDLWYWIVTFGFLEGLTAVTFSAWLIVSVHIVFLLVVADFLYYYGKARADGHGFDEDTPIPSAFDP